MRDIFVHDRDFDEDGIFDEPGGITTVRITVASDGSQCTGTGRNVAETIDISDDGRFVSFDSADSTCVAGTAGGVFFLQDRDFDDDGVYDEPNEIITYSYISYGGELSGDGSFYALGQGYTNAYVYDVIGEQLAIVDVAFGGGAANGEMPEGYIPFISSDGRYIALVSEASNLVIGDSNGFADVFVAPNPFLP